MEPVCTECGLAHEDNLCPVTFGQEQQEALAAFAAEIGSESPLTGLARLAGEFWRSLVVQGVPGHYASILVAQWLACNGSVSTGDGE